MLWDEGGSIKNYLKKEGIELSPTPFRGGVTILQATKQLRGQNFILHKIYIEVSLGSASHFKGPIL
jgi:hypothetical protein